MRAPAGGQYVFLALLIHYSDASVKLPDFLGSWTASEPVLALPPGFAMNLNRWVVADLTAGWRSSVFPMSVFNDDATPPFPAPVSPPGRLTDAPDPALDLLIYRILMSDGSPAPYPARYAKDAGGVRIHF